MKTLTIILAGQLLALATLCAGSPIEPKSLVVLGHIDGKTFYYDITQTNQTMASATCAAGGTTLAAISSVTELDFLSSKYSASGFDGLFWTDGVDARQPQQFVWNAGATDMADGLRWISFAPVETCVLYLASSSTTGNGHVASISCVVHFGALCQSVD